MDNYRTEEALECTNLGEYFSIPYKEFLLKNFKFNFKKFSTKMRSFYKYKKAYKCKTIRQIFSLVHVDKFINHYKSDKNKYFTSRDFFLKKVSFDLVSLISRRIYKVYFF